MLYFLGLQEVEIGQPILAIFPLLWHILLMQDEILVLDYWLARPDWLGRGPDMAIGPLQSVLEVLPIAQLLNIASDAKIFTKLRFIMNFQRQIEVIVVLGGVLCRPALLVLWI